MADKPDKKPKDEDAKAISSSDLDPDELAKAIEQSVAEESKMVKADISKKQSQNSDNKTDKPEEKPAKSQTEEIEQDQGVPIIVKRRSGYVAPPTGSTSKSNSTEDSKPIEPPSKTQKTLDPSTASDKPAAAPPAKEETTEAVDSPPEPARDAVPAKESAASAAAVTSEEPAKSESTANKPAEKETEPVNENNRAPAGTKDPTEPQKPTVFDTTEYNLPIKARNRKYVNSAVAWVVLTIVLVLAAGYVFYRLGIVELGDVA